MRARIRINKEISTQQSREIKPKSKALEQNRNVRQESNSAQSKRTSSRFRCWTCGLYQGDAELCLRCANQPTERMDN